VTEGTGGADRPQALCERFEDSGPVLAAFGLYLAGRSDLLDAADCLALSHLADRAPAASPATVEDHLRRQLGADPAHLFEAFAVEPERTRLLVQTHRARTADGDRPVEVTLVRPGLEPVLEAALAAGLPGVRALAAEVLAGTAVAVAPVVEDFRRSLECDLDLAARAESLDALERQARGDRDVRFPAVERRSSGAGVLTLERLNGRRLSDLLDGSPGAARKALARRLHVAWLRLALGGRWVPAQVHPADVAALDDGRIAFLGGPFVRLGPEIRGTLWSYLATASDRDPADASDALFGWMAATDGSAAARRRRERLRHRLRHVVLFRDGGWGGVEDGLAEHLLAQWRLARELGERPTPEGLLFLRGLTSIAVLGRRLAPSDDPLRAALEHLRVLRGVDRLRRAVGPGDAAGTLASYATLLAELPGWIDRALTLAESGRLRGRPSDRSAPAPRPRKRPAVFALAVFVALATIAGVAFRVGGADALDPGAQTLAAGLLVVFGGALLWLVSRKR